MRRHRFSPLAAALPVVASLSLLAGCGAPSVETHLVDGVTYFTYSPTGFSPSIAMVATGSFSIENGCVVVHLTPADEQGHTAVFIGTAQLSPDKTTISIDNTTIPLNGQEVEYLANDVKVPGLDNTGPCPNPTFYTPVWSRWTSPLPR